LGATAAGNRNLRRMADWNRVSPKDKDDQTRVAYQRKRAQARVPTPRRLHQGRRRERRRLARGTDGGEPTGTVLCQGRTKADRIRRQRRPLPLIKKKGQASSVGGEGRRKWQGSFAERVSGIGGVTAAKQEVKKEGVSVIGFVWADILRRLFLRLSGCLEGASKRIEGTEVEKERG